MADKTPLLQDDAIHGSNIHKKMSDISDNLEEYQQQENDKACQIIIGSANKAEPNASEADYIAGDMLQHQNTNRALFTKGSNKKKKSSSNSNSCWDKFMATICCKK